MIRFAARRLLGLGALCLLLSGCVYYPYGYGYGYAPPRYRYAPPAYAYAPLPAYSYGPYPARPYGSPSGYPQTLGPSGDTPGATGGD